MDLYSSAHAFLIDSGNSGLKGGTGIPFDWKLIPKIENDKIIVAGGINSSNVSDLLSKNHNIFGIDVNSGLESKEAIKDIEKIETFFKVLKKNG
jgi:phosphoribosylanthranilate isomerase